MYSAPALAISYADAERIIVVTSQANRTVDGTTLDAAGMMVQGEAGYRVFRATEDSGWNKHGGQVHLLIEGGTYG